MKLMKTNSIDNILKWGEKQNITMTIKSNTEEMSWSPKHFQLHFNPDYTKLKLPAETENIPI